MGMKEEMVEQDCPNKKGSSLRIKQARLQQQTSIAMETASSPQSDTGFFMQEFDSDVGNEDQEPLMTREELGRPITRLISSSSVSSGRSATSDFDHTHPSNCVRHTPRYLGGDRFFVKQVKDVPFNAKVVDSVCIPLVLYSVTLDLSLNDGVDKKALLSTRMFQHFASRKLDKLKLIVEPVTEDRKAEENLVSVSINNIDKCTTVKMSNLSPMLAEKAETLLNISPALDNLMSINCKQLPVEDDKMIKVELSVNIQSTIARIKMAFEANPILTSLPMQDQLIMMKEAAAEIVAISSLFVYLRSNEESFSFPCFDVSSLQLCRVVVILQKLIISLSFFTGTIFVRNQS